MPHLSTSEISELLLPYLQAPASPALCLQLSTYLDLLLRWNNRTNLTAIRDPREIVRRHFGESLFAAQHLPAGATTLLDFGSGAGFPGLPIALICPQLRVTLAEAHQKKASFLREVIRTLDLSVEVWARRAEALPSTMRFEIVTLRAVDQMEQALVTAKTLLGAQGCLCILTTRSLAKPDAKMLPLPGSATGVLSLQMFHVEQ